VVNRSSAGSSDPSRTASTSSHPIGVDTVAPARARSEYGATVVFAGLFWLQSMSTLPGRSAFSIRQTTSSGVSAESSWASCLAYRLGCSRSAGVEIGA
jgi:hypothetical protein